MKRLFLFAIGGTGARVVRSLTMMLAAGVKGLDSSYEIIPLIIDYDLSNGDKDRAIKSLETYANIHNALYPDVAKGNNYSDHFFMTQIKPLPSANPIKPYEFFFGPQTSEKFAQYLSKNALNTNQETFLTEELLEALYDTSDSDSKDAELELDMAKGFKGNPNIGAVVFHELKKSPEYKKFASTFDQTSDKVFIVASIFGGTGASGFPELVNAIRSDVSHAAVQNAQIGAALILPYFKLQPFNPNLGDTGAIDAASFNSKTKAALGFYATQNGINSKVNNLYYIGDENEDDYEYAEGEVRQQNKAHVVEFIAATSILDFLINPNSMGVYEFAVKDAQLQTSMKLPDFHDSAHRLILDDLSTFALAMKYYRDVVCGDRNKVRNSVAFYNTFQLNNQLGKGIWEKINDFLDCSKNNKWGFYSWLDELNDHAHKLHLYRMGKQYDLSKFMAHISVEKKHFWSENPLSDDVFSAKLNAKSTSIQVPSNTQFLKVLREVSNETYKEL